MLTAAEQSLLTCAARIMTAIKYKEAHPERTFDYMEENLSMEMVRAMYRLFNDSDLFYTAMHHERIRK